MEPISLTLGAVSLLLQTHRLALDCISALHAYSTANHDSSAYSLMLQIEKYNLRGWGRKAGLADGTLQRRLPEEEDRAMALMVLRQVVETVAETEGLKKRYGLRFETVSASGEGEVRAQKKFGAWTEGLVGEGGGEGTESTTTATHTLVLRGLAGSGSPRGSGNANESGEAIELSQDLSACRGSMEKAKSALSFFRKVRFVVTDKQQFQALVDRLHYFNSFLDKLLNNSQTHDAEVMNLSTTIIPQTPAGELPALETATARLYPEFSQAVGVRRQVTGLEQSIDGRQSGEPSSATTLPPQRSMVIQESQLELRHRDPKVTRTLATYTPTHGRSRRVLVEWRPFETELTWHTRRKTLQQVETLARILSKQPKPAACRVLDCIGYCAGDTRIAFVFELPPGTKTNRDPRSLLQLLRTPESETCIPIPPLEERLALAQALCTGLHYLHLCELIHKSVRANNIVFFRKEGAKDFEISQPYITGFDYSRLDGPDDSTITRGAEGPDEDRYRHPQSLNRVSRRSTKLHDIYSLGLVLLEVAMWWSLKDIVLDKLGSEVKDFVRSGDGPFSEVLHLVGTRYQEVVDKCLQGNFELDAEGREISLPELFLEAVVQEMLKCNV